jgi:hypothetical protein
MKKILFIFILIGISCKESYGNVNMALTVKGETVFEIQKNDSIIGDWVISKSIWMETKHEKGKLIKTEAAIVCNVCSTIIFKKDGEGILKKGNGYESSFNWFICKDKIYFSFDKKKDEHEFFSLDKEFRFKIYHDSKFHYLELIQKKEGDKYVLIR